MVLPSGVLHKKFTPEGKARFQIIKKSKEKKKMYRKKEKKNEAKVTQFWELFTPRHETKHLKS